MIHGSEWATKKEIEGTLFLGKPITNLTKEELLELCSWQAGQALKNSERHSQQINFMEELSDVSARSSR